MLFTLKTDAPAKKINFSWNGEQRQDCSHSVFLGVTLDRNLTFREHVNKTRAKVSTRNKILRKLATSKWGATSHVMRTSALALSYSAAEYACPVREQSAHAKRLGPVLNKCCRLITGCLKPANVDNLHQLAGIAPPEIRREAASKLERSRQAYDHRHMFFNHQPAPSRLKSRRSFLHCVEHQMKKSQPGERKRETKAQSTATNHSLNHHT